jgi:hypothetical protein
MGSEYQVLNALAKETITAIDNSTARSFDSNLITQSGRSKALEALVVVEDESIRFWTTGDTPTASVGILIRAGESFILKGHHDIKNFKAISISGTDSKITAQYYFPF